LEHQFNRNGKPEPENLPSPVSCSIHPWMRGWLLIKDHPYMGVSDADGKVVIKNLPVGKWTFQFWHERAGNLREVKRNGESVQWTRGRLEVEIKPSLNDLGEIKLGPSLFSD
jgi:hypothetical protein